MKPLLTPLPTPIPTPVPARRAHHHSGRTRLVSLRDAVELLRGTIRSEVRAAVREHVGQQSEDSSDAGIHDLAMMTVPQVAQLLQVDRKTVYEWIRRGRLPAVRAGTAVRVRRSAVRDFLEARAPSKGGAPSIDDELTRILRAVAPNED